MKYSDPLLALLEVRDTERQVIIIEYLSKQSLITVCTKMKETTSIFCVRNKDWELAQASNQANCSAEWRLHYTVLNN